MIDFIVDLIKKLLTWLLDFIFSFVDFPVIPPELVQAVNVFFDYLRAGMGFVNFVLPLDQIQRPIALFLGVYAAVHGYSLIMWILRKVPFLNIK